MYLSSPTKIWEAGTGGTGVTAPADRWFFGEGATGDFFDAWILLSNPGSTDATVDVRYVADSGADVTRTHTVPAGRRITIRVVDEDAGDDEHLVRHLRDLDQRGAGRRRARDVVALRRGPVDGRATSASASPRAAGSG